MRSTLYFAYTALLDPARLTKLIPEAEFEFIAHLPETRMTFPIKDAAWDGGLPSIDAEDGNTVWGAVFSIPTTAVGAIAEAEAAEGRSTTDAFKAVDQQGHSHPILTHAHPESTSDHSPSRDYMAIVVQGAKHWGLPTGWVAGLEEYLEEPLI